MNGKELIKLAKANGFKEDRTNGSHHQMIKDGKVITIPVHGSKDLPPGTVNAILKGLGLK